MLIIGFAVVWVGYGLASWGYEVIKGNNIPFSQWMTPTAGVWDWANGDAPKLADTQVWPSGHVKQTKSPTQAG